MALVVALSIAPPANASAVPKPPPVAKDRRTFESARDGAVAAVERADWNAFLDESERALHALPEAKDTNAERAQVMQPVGTVGLDERNDDQLRRSIAILNLYLRQLEDVYGDDADAQPGWAEARSYLADLRDRVEPVPFLPMPSTAAPFERTAPTPNEQDDRSGASGRRLVIGGGVTIGIGAVLMVVGIVQAAMWKQAGDEYERLREENDVGNVTVDEERDAATKWVRGAGGTLGTIIPGVALAGVGTALVIVGVRRGRANEGRMSFGPGGMRARF